MEDYYHRVIPPSGFHFTTNPLGFIPNTPALEHTLTRGGRRRSVVLIWRMVSRGVVSWGAVSWGVVIWGVIRQEMALSDPSRRMNVNSLPTITLSTKATNNPVSPNFAPSIVSRNTAACRDLYS